MAKQFYPDIMATNLRDRFMGSIIGCAVGDALGAPFEGADAASINVELGPNVNFQKIPGFVLGQYTDDTQMTLAIIRAICRAKRVDGAEIAAEFARLWKSREIVGAGASCTEGVYNVIAGKDWRESGTAEGRAGNGTAMRASPIGLWNHDRPEKIAEDSRISSIITHKDSRSIAGTIAVAKAVQMCVHAEEIDPGEFVRSISAAARPASALFARCIEELPRWIALEPAEALPHIYAAGEPDIGPRRPKWVTAYVVPTVLCSLYCFLKSPRNYPDTVVGAIRAGGDTDTAAAIAGSISGAFNGMRAIPTDLVEGLKDSREILALAKDFFLAVMERNQDGTP